MARIVKPAEARSLGLAGRVSNEIVAGDIGAASVTLRLVEIPVPAPGEQLRGRHVHHGFEECMYVMSGEGVTHSGEGRHEIAAGDTILVPAGERHVTRNTGSVPLVMLCFFPVADIRPGTEEFPPDA